MAFFNEVVEHRRNCLIIIDVESKAFPFQKTLQAPMAFWGKRTPIMPSADPDGEHVVETVRFCILWRGAQRVVDIRPRASVLAFIQGIDEKNQTVGTQLLGQVGPQLMDR